MKTFHHIRSLVLCLRRFEDWDRYLHLHLATELLYSYQAAGRYREYYQLALILIRRHPEVLRMSWVSAVSQNNFVIVRRTAPFTNALVSNQWFQDPECYPVYRELRKSIMTKTVAQYFNVEEEDKMFIRKALNLGQEKALVKHFGVELGSIFESCRDPRLGQIIRRHFAKVDLEKAAYTGQPARNILDELFEVS